MIRHNLPSPERITSFCDNPGKLVRYLFEAEVPEIKDGVVVIKSLARQPGKRTEIAVMSNDPGVDAVFACAGVKGAHLQAITRELRGEKIEVIEWSAYV